MQVSKCRVWLTSPRHLASMDLSSPIAFVNSVGVSLQPDDGIDMTAADWKLLGTATLSFDFTPTRESLIPEAVRVLEEDLREFDRKTHEARRALVDKIANLQAIAYITPGEAA